MRIGIDMTALAAFAGTAEAADLIDSLPADNDGVLDDLDSVAELLREITGAKVLTVEALPNRITDSSVQSVDVSVTDDGNTYSIDFAARVVWTVNYGESGVWLHVYGDGNCTCNWFDTAAAEPTAVQVITYMAEQLAAHLNGELSAQQAAWNAMLTPTEVHILYVEDKRNAEITVHPSAADLESYFARTRRRHAWDDFDPTAPIESILENSGGDVTMRSMTVEVPGDFNAGLCPEGV